MANREPITLVLPPAAAPAVTIVRRLRSAGHAALLAGGCVRDLLLGGRPADYDVATGAPPDEVARLFRATRAVGVQFGVMLVRVRGVWVEVATFRSDGDYRDGRRPQTVAFRDAETDARRRDFTVNGMFLDPLADAVIDYVGGRADLAARRIRAIGAPAERFREDHLRLLRAVRFAARLGFAIEPQTADAITAEAPRLADVAAERRLDELARMLADPRRATAWELLLRHGLAEHLWERAAGRAPDDPQAVARLALLPAGARFETALATVLHGLSAAEVERICRALACSNEQRGEIVWLVTGAAELARRRDLTLAELKRSMARGPAFAALLELARSVLADRPAALRELEALAARAAAVPAEAVSPAPWVTGDDLLARGVAPGPVYGAVLRELYERQLEGELPTRAAALAALDERLGDPGSEQKGAPS